MKKHKIKWPEITSKFVGIPYNQNSWDIRNGLDCLSFFILFLRELGHKPKLEFKGITPANAVELWKTDRNKANELWIEYIKNNSIEVSESNMKNGDILVAELMVNNKKEICFGFYFQPTNILISHTNCKIGLHPLSVYNIKGVYSWV